MTTFRSGSNWDNLTWPGGSDPETTTWTYQVATGLLETKTYADGKSVAYTYTATGQLDTRTWARRLNQDPDPPVYPVTTYGYQPLTSELTSISYSDGTPAVTFTYDRLGRHSNVKDAVDESYGRTFQYNSDLQLGSETIRGLVPRTISRSYSTAVLKGRPIGLNVSTEYEATNEYDSYGRPSRFTGPGLPANGALYSYPESGGVPVSNLVERVEFKDAADATFGESVRTFEDQRDLIQSVANSWGTTLVSQYGYQNDALRRRMSMARSGSAFAIPGDNFDVYGYNARNELISSERFLGNDPQNPDPAKAVDGGRFGYHYDDIGNRVTGGDPLQPGGTLPNKVRVDYDPDDINELNQYERLTEHPGLCDVQNGTEITACDGAAGDNFGCAVSATDSFALVGAYLDKTGGNDVQTGSAYVCEGTPPWTKLVASDGAAQDFFGISVSASAVNGPVALIGAHGVDLTNPQRNSAGAAYVFRKGTTWQEETKLTLGAAAASSDYFGYSVSIYGNVAIVGAYGRSSSRGAAYVFRYSGGSWGLEQELLANGGANGDKFGYSVSISGDDVLIGAPGRHDSGTSSGAAYLFHYSQGWDTGTKIEPADGAVNKNFGSAVSVSGSVAIVGAYGDGDYGANAGAAYMFRGDGGTWTQEAKLTAFDAAAGDRFGRAVGVSQVGGVSTAVVGAYLKTVEGKTSGGAAYIFRFYSPVWRQMAKLTRSNPAAYDYFGYSVGIKGSTAVVGAMYVDKPGQSNQGAAYTFTGLTDSDTNGTLDPCDSMQPTFELAYDDDGNLTSDDRWEYTWDEENRLAEVKTRLELGPNPLVYDPGDLKVTYTYDYMSRRVRKMVSSYTAQGWSLTRDERFLYDGWNLLQVMDGLHGNAVKAKYTWGLDLSGTFQGAGGIGGLLGTEDRTGTVANAKSISLNGRDQYVNVPDDALLRFGHTSFTIEAWVQLATLSTSSDPGQTVAMRKMLNRPDSDADYIFLANAGTRGAFGDELALVWGNGSGGVTVALSTLRIRDTGKWHYVSAAYDASAGRVRFALDNSTDTVTPTDQGHCTLAGGLTLGASHGAFGVFKDFLNGLLDEVRISRGVVPIDQQLNAWPEHCVEPPAEVVSWHRFEVPGMIVLDYSGNGLDGTVVGQAGYSTSVADPLVPWATQYVCYADANGNVVQVLDREQDGAVVAHYDYDPYGNTLAAAGPYAAFPFRFSSKYFDSETELYYYGYRYYSPEMGRWVSTDPIEEAGGLNLYGFIGNSALTGYDPRGLRDKGGCNPPPGHYTLPEAAVDKWVRVLAFGLKPLARLLGDAAGAVDLKCKFKDASQKGGILPPAICTKRCKYECTGDGKITAQIEGLGSLVYTWSFGPITVCTKSLVWCKPSCEPHVCEDCDQLSWDKVAPSKNGKLTVDGQEWGPIQPKPQPPKPQPKPRPKPRPTRGDYGDDYDQP